MAKQPSKGRKTPTKQQKAAIKTPKAPESPAESTPLIDAIPAEVHAKPAPAPEPTPDKSSVPAVEKTEPKQEKPEPKEEQVATTPPPSPVAPPPPARSGGFFPLLFGGLIAGVIGYAIATFTTPAQDTTLSNQVATQATAIGTLEERIAGIDLTAIEATQNALATDISGLTEALADITARVEALEERPAGTVTTVDGTVVSGEIDALRAQIAEMTGAAQTELDEARATAASIEENAAAAARNAAARAALARVQTALESGAPIGAALGDLEEATGTSAPDALTAVQDGVPTLASLQELFPEVARAALATARSEGVSGEETTGFGAFIRNQLDVRSTAPREGTDADAVLSRAEEAVRTGRLSDALAEISALPEVARAAMSDWLAPAEARASAIAAVDILSSSLSDN